jgi:hypothetical protein
MMAARLWLAGAVVLLALLAAMLCRTVHDIAMLGSS